MIIPSRNRRLRREAEKAAERDAEAGIDEGRRWAVAALGPRPSYDPEQYPDQSYQASDLLEEPRIQELLELNTGANGQGPEPPALPAPVLAGAGTFFLFVEAVASTRLMMLLGVAEGDQLLLGLALAAGITAAAYGVHNAIEGKVKGGMAVALVIVTVLMLVATAGLRLADLMVPGEGLASWSGTILLIFAAAGPAVLSELCFRTLRESAPDRRTRANLKRQLRSTEKGFNRARKDVMSMGEAQRQWDSDHSLFMAAYNAFLARFARENSNSKNGAMTNA